MDSDIIQYDQYYDPIWRMYLFSDGDDYLEDYLINLDIGIIRCDNQHHIYKIIDKHKWFLAKIAHGF